MPIDFSELSSTAELLDQLTRRLGAMAEAAEGEHDETLARELFGIERAVGGAQRRIARIVRAHRPRTR